MALCLGSVQVVKSCSPNPACGVQTNAMIEFSADALTASNPRRVGQGSTGAGTPHGRRDGSKARAAMKCFLPGLDEARLHDMARIQSAKGWSS